MGAALPAQEGSMLLPKLTAPVHYRPSRGVPGAGSPTARSALAWGVKQLLLGLPHRRLRTELPRLG